MTDKTQLTTPTSKSEAKPAVQASQVESTEQVVNQQQLESEITARLTSALTSDILKAERSRVGSIMSACTNMNRQDLVMGFIEKGSTIEEASHQILNTMANDSEQTQIISTVTPYPNNGDENPLIKNAQQRANNIGV